MNRFTRPGAMDRETKYCYMTPDIRQAIQYPRSVRQVVEGVFGMLPNDREFDRGLLVANGSSPRAMNRWHFRP